ncbi:ranBP2-type zinc finger protein At1g67325 isoform X2 [Salvia hispanica]|uniref:ranBP2-type zinc finger protein At1g67325 isoform X2 n=1 Tax=Salvia hispanica TaxID=49212 RepID=UPI002008FEEC|nr:ranBP2-type zinc finger protein At1g67325 isoform X2 [Salvia hispanica]
MAGGGGKEGDWECGGCHNRNYAFRSFCNRCKQPRLLVDTNTPADSKWLPRIGDWICTGCTNNNYASREKCKKCGQPKELAAMPAVAIPGASVPTHPTYFARARGGMEQMVNVGSIHPSISLNSDWSIGGANQYGNQPSDLYGLLSVSNWPLGGGSISGLSYPSQANLHPPAPNGNGWRSGDWMCTCGFHNYSSRLQCKKCNAPAPISAPASLGSPVTAHGTKRLASEEFAHNFDNKRLNAGQQPNSGLDPFQSRGGSQVNSMYTPMHSVNTPIPPNWQVNLQVSRLAPAPAHVGKGAKQWRDGDWMCSNCNNHNYASREQCNRCKSMREVPVQPVSVA